ncbi:hypothetical protein Bca4012_038358 [Brassica carinata]
MEQDIQEETMIVQGIDHSQIKEVTLSHSTSTFSSLAGASLAPSDKNIMEETPSCMVIDETTNSEDDVLNDPYLVIPSMDHSEGEPQTQMTTTRGGRLIMQTQKHRKWSGQKSKEEENTPREVENQTPKTLALLQFTMYLIGGDSFWKFMK